eukprot:TRINITY_DN5357_c0_g2_i2.p1 TRINITY_DN5357_c0_g2~~TRINITY_DN5357_c0_g2_i2.p1  ORF type:complete len:397 (-),score=88.68 TRINITY_DN5357_c0_g2_i2:18-1109(-)
MYMPSGDRDMMLVEKVEECDRQAQAARQDQDYHALLVQLETGLHLRRKLYEEASQEVTAACRKLCEACNYAATMMLQKEQLAPALELLKRAEKVADRSDLDRATTWNNLACYYRRTNKLRAAISYLERALAIEEHAGNLDAAQTHLNLCATLSQLKRHSEALSHAQSALIRVYENLSPQLFNGSFSEEISETGREQFTVLCIAYHNLAVEHEHLKNLESAVCAYAEGFKWASKFLGPSHQLVGILQSAADSTKAKLPKTSSAVRRASELMEGWPQPQPAAAEQAERSQHLDALLTPREPPDDEGPPPPPPPPPQGTEGMDNTTSRYSAGNTSDEYSQFSGGSYSEQASRNSSQTERDKLKRPF